MWGGVVGVLYLASYDVCKKSQVLLSGNLRRNESCKVASSAYFVLQVTMCVQEIMSVAEK